MILFFFSYHKQYKLTSHSYALLQSFGFSENASFNITISTDHQFEALIALTEFPSLFAKYAQGGGEFSACSHPEKLPHQILSPKLSGAQNYSWSGQISNKSILTPAILFCSKESTYAVSIQFANKNSLLDYRCEDFPLMFAVISLTYSFIVVIWIANTLYHSEFCIGIELMISLLPAFKAIVSYMESYQWSFYRNSDTLPNNIELGSNAFYCLYLSYSLVVFGLIIFGFNTFRSSLSRQEYLIAILSPVSFFFTCFIGDIINTESAALFAGVIVFLSTFFYFGTIINSIRLIQEIRFDDGIMGKKANIVWKTILETGVLLIISMILLVPCIEVDSPVAMNLLEEFFVIGVHISLIKNFLLRKEYRGKEDEISFEDKEVRIVSLEEPDSVSISVISV